MGYKCVSEESFMTVVSTVKQRQLIALRDYEKRGTHYVSLKRRISRTFLVNQKGKVI